ncbi:hypothetical protein CDN97_21835 [Pantoea sp. AMG 501]|nr:hypothetical protein CDN97_21835 [Pantoea sp. AMG 501]
MYFHGQSKTILAKRFESDLGSRAILAGHAERWQETGTEGQLKTRKKKTPIIFLSLATGED